MGHSIDSVGAQNLVVEIADSVERNPGAIISLARLKTADDFTYRHPMAVCAMMVGQARQLGLDDVPCRSAGLSACTTTKK